MGDFVDEEIKPVVINAESKRPRLKVDKKLLIYELKILIACSRSGHKKYLQYPKFNIETSEQLNIRINDLINLISK